VRGQNTRGVVWLKAAGAETAFEVGLYGLLERVVPDRILVPIARDAGRGWMLLPDGGVRLGERLDDLDLVEAMVEVLPRYGQLQRDLGPHTDELLGLGIADMRAAVMPERFQEAVAAVGRYVGRHGNEGDRETLRRAEAMAGRFQGWCQRLGGAAVGASLDHNDLHFWNVFVDAYLEVFGDLASHGELVEELELACRVGKVGRALSWDRALRLQGEEEAGELADAPLRALESLLSDSAIVAV
jgi:hypothetical protein